MNRILLWVLGAAAPLCIVGCQDSTTQNYHLYITNRADSPLTLWLTKQNPPYDPGLAPPEDEAVGTSVIMPAQASQIEPGQSIETLRTIKIENGNVAVLRVYKAKDFNAILAISRGNPDRLDFMIEPGQTDIDIIHYEGHLAAVPHRPATQPGWEK